MNYKSIALEGCDCAGKTYTLKSLIQDRDLKQELREYRFPSAFFRDYTSKLDISAKSLFHLLIADHANNLALAQYENASSHLIMDRSVLSFAYQILFGVATIDEVLCLLKSGLLFIPSDVILLDPGVKVIMHRLESKNLDGIESQLNEEKIKKLYDIYTQLAIELNCNLHVIQSVELNAEDTKQKIKEIINAKC